MDVVPDFIKGLPTAVCLNRVWGARASSSRRRLIVEHVSIVDEIPCQVGSPSRAGSVKGKYVRIDFVPRSGAPALDDEEIRVGHCRASFSLTGQEKADQNGIVRAHETPRFRPGFAARRCTSCHRGLNLGVS